MSAGKAGEYAHPYRLLVNKIGDETITNQDGKFAQMVLATGYETAQSLFEIAKQQYYRSLDKFPDESVDMKDYDHESASKFVLPPPSVRGN